MSKIAKLIKSIPDMDFVPHDTSSLQSEVYALYEEMTGKTLYPGAPERLFIDTFVAALVRNRFLTDFGIKQNTLKYARGNAQNLLGERRGCYRLDPAASVIDFEFRLKELLEEDLLVPEGTIVLVDEVIEFALDGDLIIPSGEDKNSCRATATKKGGYANGFVAGQVQKLKESIEEISEVVNISESRFGTDIEKDEVYQERIALAAHQFSTSSTPAACEYFVRSISAEIADVSVIHPSAGRREVYLLLVDGRLPGEGLCLEVLQELMRDDRRPGTLQINVLSPSLKEYSIALNYWTDPAYGTRQQVVADNVRKQVLGFTEYCRSKLATSVIPSELIKRIQEVAGVLKVEVPGLEYLSVEPSELAVCSGFTVAWKGDLQ